MPKLRKLTGKHCAGGLDVGTGAFNIKPEQNTESRNMEYTIDGECLTSLGYSDPGWDWGEDGHGIDGMHRVDLYPDLIFAAVNGKIKYVDATIQPQSAATVYTVDTGLSLTAGAPVFFKDYRGMLYFCNGVEPIGRIAISRLASQLTTTPADETISLRTASYTWTLSGSGTNEYYVRLASSNPNLSEPTSVIINGVTATKAAGGVTLIGAGEWAYGNSDSLGYTTIYVRLSDGTDPDTKSLDYVQAVYADQIILEDASGYRFNNSHGTASLGGVAPTSADKVYIEGDEIDYLTISDYGYGDKLNGASNIATTHPVGAYVTMYSSIPSAPIATTIAFFRDTLFASGMPDEPGVVRYADTISAVGELLTGNLHDFAAAENYIIGDGGAVTALQSTETRLYVFLKEKVHFIPIVYDTDGNQIFDVSHLFTGVYGCPNAFCVTQMEDVVIFFTGKRLIRIGFDPNGQQLIPDEAFDREILPLLQDADEDQTDARITYNPSRKEKRLRYMENSIGKVIKYHKQLDVFSNPSDEDASCYVVHRRNTYFGDINSDVTWKIGAAIDSGTENTIHRYQTGRIDNGSKNWKLYLRGTITGRKTAGSKVYFVKRVDNKNVGVAQLIPESAMDFSAAPTSLGEEVVGEDAIGLGSDAIPLPSSTLSLYPFVYKFMIGRRGKDFSFAISSEDSGALWAIRDFDVEWQEYDNEPRTHY